MRSVLWNLFLSNAFGSFFVERSVDRLTSWRFRPGIRIATTILVLQRPDTTLADFQKIELSAAQYTKSFLEFIYSDKLATLTRRSNRTDTVFVIFSPQFLLDSTTHKNKIIIPNAWEMKRWDWSDIEWETGSVACSPFNLPHKYVWNRLENRVNQLRLRITLWLSNR